MNVNFNLKIVNIVIIFYFYVKYFFKYGMNSYICGMILKTNNLKKNKMMKEIKRLWYCSITETIYKAYPGIRLTDSQLAKLIAEQFDGSEGMHLANIRRSRCNDSEQAYVKENLTKPVNFIK